MGTLWLRSAAVRMRIREMARRSRAMAKGLCGTVRRAVDTWEDITPSFRDDLLQGMPLHATLHEEITHKINLFLSRVMFFEWDINPVAESVLNSKFLKARFLHPIHFFK